MRRCLILFLVAILFVGCEKAAVPVNPGDSGEIAQFGGNAAETSITSDNAHDPMAIRVGESSEAEQLKAEIERLQSELKRHEMEKPGLESHLHQEAYRRLNRFQSADGWDELTVYNEENRVTISDPDFLESLRPWLDIGEQISWGGAIPYTLEPFFIELKTGNETVLLHAAAKGAVEFPDILPGICFKAETELTNLGKALLPKPDFLPEESLGSRMLDSGFLLIRRGGDQYYDFSESRIRTVSVAFLRADKKEVAKPGLKDDERLAEVAFFQYGEEIVMDIYPEWIRIKDGASEIWYEIDPFDAGQMEMALRAD